MSVPTTPEQPRSGLDYRAVWRWHFYAGLYCIPFVILLSISGTIYLFGPQIEAWQDRDFDGLAFTGAPASAADQIRAALGALETSTFSEYQAPTAPHDAARVLLRQGGETYRVYVHPQSLAVLQTVRENDRFLRVVRRLHGELLIGDWGSHLVELAACWTIILLLTGLYLWWPRNSRGLAGVLYPRLRSGSRVFWRDIHAVTGIWISAGAVFLIVSGLPWANFWGEYFRNVRTWTGTAVARQDWSTRGEGAAASGEHAEHGRSRRGGGGAPQTPPDLEAVDRILATIAPLQLPPPVMIGPPRGGGNIWAARSMTPNRPLRVTMEIDGSNGEIVRREYFEDRHWIDRAVGTGIAIHEGQMFGWFNQLLGLLTTSGLVLLSVSGVVLWWRRRDQGVLGAPQPGLPSSLSWGMVAVVLLLATALPMFGASLIAVLLLERLALRRLPGVQTWLGLRKPGLPTGT